tara:strand:- start:774 stop:1217 length:444 start_codon:yes stop_codon:yes gene_type:complete
MGILVVILSFLIGNYAKVLFILHWNEPLFRNWMIVLYIITWLMLALGVWWVGKEYADAVRRYTSYKFYHEHAKKGVKKAVDVGVTSTRKVVKVGKKTVAVGRAKSKEVVAKGKKQVSAARRRGKERARKAIAKGRKKVNDVRTRVRK